MQKIFKAAVSMSIFLGVVSVVQAGPHHKYISGVVQSIGNNQVVIGAGTYKMSSGITIMRLENRGNGVYYQRKGRLSDVNPGMKVYLKTIGHTVSQIEVER
jgi:hypothetical protein